jgi:hypothetical protein
MHESMRVRSEADANVRIWVVAVEGPLDPRMSAALAMTVDRAPRPDADGLFDDVRRRSAIGGRRSSTAPAVTSR